jgi:hypothetical protein
MGQRSGIGFEDRMCWMTVGVVSSVPDSIVNSTKVQIRQSGLDIYSAWISLARRMMTPKKGWLITVIGAWWHGRVSDQVSWNDNDEGH